MEVVDRQVDQTLLSTNYMKGLLAFDRNDFSANGVIGDPLFTPELDAFGGTPLGIDLIRNLRFGQRYFSIAVRIDGIE